MARTAKKKARYMNFYVDITIADRLEAFSQDSGIPKTRIVENALTQYLQEAEAREKILAEYSSRSQLR